MWEFLLITVFLSYAGHLVADLVTNHGVYLVKFFSWMVPLRLPWPIAFSTGGILERLIVTPVLLIAVAFGALYLPYREYREERSVFVQRIEKLRNNKDASIIDMVPAKIIALLK